MNLEGKLLGNRYEIIERIGNGGMATVYKARCLVLKRYVAVKILRDEFTTDNEFIKRFNVEAESAASLTHPNIVSVYDVGHEDNFYYIVMELVKGKTLKEIIIEDGALAWKWSVKIAKQIASALEIAHRNNIVHRDIKPHNIIITEDGTAKVTDFGIAKAVSNSTITAFGTTIGSVHYFSPEHAKGSYTDSKSDLYSLGVVLYEMVTGKVPFDADTPVSVALKHMQEEPIEPIVLKPGLPKSLNKIIMKAMQKEPNLRYQTATEIIRDLDMSLRDTEGAFVTSVPNDFATQRVSLNYDKKEGARREEKKKGIFVKMKDFFEKHPVLKWANIILTFGLVFLLSVMITLGILNSGKVESIQIPNFVGMTVEEAKLEAEKFNLVIQEEEGKYDVEIPEGEIISQEPIYQANYTVKEGSTIKIVASLGQEIVKVTKVTGLTKDEAVNTLKAQGLVPTIKEEYDDEVEKDYVIEQSVLEGEEILAGSEVIITVSMGIEQVEVPDLSGMSETAAKAAITKAKLKWKSTTKISDSSRENGVVVEQSISEGSMVDKDTEITITVNEFDEVKSATLTVNVKSLTNYKLEYTKDEEGNEIPVEPDNVNLKIVVGSDTVYRESVSEDSTAITTKVSGTGTVTVKVYVDDVLKGTESLNLNTTSSLTID